MSDTPHQLPADKLAKIQSVILDHFKSLNAAGKFVGEKVTRDDALNALGFRAPMAAEQWLCGVEYASR